MLVVVVEVLGKIVDHHHGILREHAPREQESKGEPNQTVSYGSVNRSVRHGYMRA